MIDLGDHLDDMREALVANRETAASLRNEVAALRGHLLNTAIGPERLRGAIDALTAVMTRVVAEAHPIATLAARAERTEGRLQESEGQEPEGEELESYEVLDSSAEDDDMSAES